MRPFAVLSLLALTISVCTSETLWTENFADAKARAAKEGKDLLIDFTGSDWCGWCIKLKEEVFNQQAFTSLQHPEARFQILSGRQQLNRADSEADRYGSDPSDQ